MPKTSFPTLSLKEFSQTHAAEKKFFPRSGQWELTFRCNYRCQHCYIPPEDLAGKHQNEDLTYEEACAVVDQLYQAGVLSLTFTGGDPLIRRDFLDIYLYAKKKGFLLTVFTNGSLVTDRVAEIWEDYPPFMVEISLYGMTKETYERVTQIPGSFERCRQGIRRLVERKIPLTLKTPGLTLNYDEILKIKAFAGSIGAQFKFDADLHPRLDGGREPLAFRLRPEQIIEIEYGDPEMREEWRYQFEEDCGAMSPPSELVFPCSVGKKSFYIGPNGHLTHCNYVRSPSYDLRRHRVVEAFEALEAQLRQLHMPAGEIPHQCGAPKQCMRCPGRALLEEGDPTKAVVYFCEVTEKRVEEKHKLFEENPDHAHR